MLKNDGGVKLRAFGTLAYADTTTFEHSNNQWSKVQSEAVGVEAGLRYDF